MKALSEKILKKPYSTLDNPL
jgi:hypothetical protein